MKVDQLPETSHNLDFHQIGYIGCIPTKTIIKGEIDPRIFQAKPIPNFYEMAIHGKEVTMNKVVNCVYPYSAIGHLTMEHNHMPFLGTAFLIGNFVALTAAHNLYSRDRQFFYSNIKLTLGLHGSGGQTINVAKVYFPKKYLQGKQKQAWGFDYAILILDTQQELGERYGYLPLSQKNVDRNSEVIVAGYPYIIQSRQSRQSRQSQMREIFMYQSKGKIKRIQDRTCTHSAGTLKGSSGSPILKYNLVHREYQVVGVHTANIEHTSQNQGVLVNRNIIQTCNKLVQLFLTGQPHNLNTFCNGIPCQKFEEKDYLSQQIQDLIRQRFSGIQRKEDKRTQYTQSPSIKGQCQDYHQLAADIFYIEGSQMYKQGSYIKAAIQYKKALKKYEEAGQQPIKFAMILNDLGTVYFEQGFQQSAKECFESSRQIKKGLNYPSKISQATSITNLGMIYKKYDQANKQYSLALEIIQKQHGELSYLCVPKLNNMACIQSDLKDWDKAVQLFKKALEIVRVYKGEQDLQCTLYLINLAHTQSQRRKYDQALEYLNQAEQIFKKSKVEHNINIAYFFYEMGIIKLKNKLKTQALKFFVQSKVQFQYCLGADNNNKKYKKACNAIIEISL